MYESTKNNKTVFAFKVRDSKAAWQVAQKFMNDKYFRPHEEFRDLYYTTAPGLGMQYLQFFKTEEEIQVVTFLGGPVHPVPLSQMPQQTSESVRTALKGMLEPLQQMELTEAAAAPAAQAEPVPEPAKETEIPVEPAEAAAPVPPQTANVQQPIPAEIPTTADAGFVAGAAPQAQPTMQQADFGYGSSTQSQAWPQDPVGTRYAYDSVNGGPNDRASNAVAGLVLSIIGLLTSFLGMGVPVLGVLGLIPLTIALILSVNGRRSRRRGIAMAGLVISIISVALVIFETLVWFSILHG